MIYITVKHYNPDIGKYSRKSEPQECGNWLNHHSNVCTRLHHEMVGRFACTRCVTIVKHSDGWRPCSFPVSPRGKLGAGSRYHDYDPHRNRAAMEGRGEKKETYVMGMTPTRNSQRHSNVWMTSPVGLNLKVPLPSTPRHKTNKKNSRAKGAANKRTTPSSQEVCVQEGRPGPTKWLRQPHLPAVR
jgi:hypothetical protein